MCVREVDLVCLCLCPPARAAKDRTFSQRCQPYVYRQREPLIRHETERGRREIKSTSSYRDSSIVLSRIPYHHDPLCISTSERLE